MGQRLDFRRSRSGCGGGDDILIAGTTTYDSDSAGSIPAHVRVSGRITAIAIDPSDSTGTILPSDGGDDSAASRRTVSDLIMADGHDFYRDPELDSIIDDLARDVASEYESRSSVQTFQGFNGTLTVATGDVNDGGIDDFTSETGDDELASGHIKIK